MKLSWRRVIPNVWQTGEWVDGDWVPGDYRITRRYAPDRGNRVRQYAAHYQPQVIGMDGLREALDNGKRLDGASWRRLEPGISLNRGQEPYRELDEAKRACQEHAEWLRAVEHGRGVD